MAPYYNKPTQRGFWYDRSRHAMVGVLLGVDMIESAKRMAIVDVNTGAAMRASRRELYGRGVDPLVTRLTDLVARQGASVQPESPAQFAAFMRDEIAKFSKVIRDANIKLE